MASLSSNADYLPDQSQSQYLQDITRNGSTDDYNTYEDLDTAVLLQSLADFEHPPSHIESQYAAEPATVSDPPTSINSQSLSPLREAFTNDGAASAHVSRRQTRLRTTAFVSSELGPSGNPYKTKKRKPAVEHEDNDGVDVGFVRTSKARRKKRAQADAGHLASGRKIWGPGYGKEGYGNGTLMRRAPVTGSDARAVGVQSAAALFRQPSAASKKYARPPMATVYMQLEVSPPRFLQLQGAAKQFMLDPEHPERAACVGNRSKGDTDMTKLKLFGCVTSFLEDLGWGDKCWGNAEPTPTNIDGSPAEKPRKLQWPEFKQEIVTMVTPLFRRMVTNERQRIYALEARRKNSAAKKLGGSKQISPTPFDEEAPPSDDERMHAKSSAPYHTIDPELNHYQYNINESSTPQQHLMFDTRISDMEVTDGEVAEAENEALTYVINIMQNGRRIKPRVALSPGSLPNYSMLVQHIEATIDTKDLGFTIKVLGPGKWLNICNDNEWMSAINVVRNAEILDREVKCAIEVGEASEDTSLV